MDVLCAYFESLSELDCSFKSTEVDQSDCELFKELEIARLGLHDLLDETVDDESCIALLIEIE